MTTPPVGEPAGLPPGRQVAIRFPPDAEDLLAEVERTAVTEQRTRSQMIRVLLGEALAERQRREDKQLQREQALALSQGLPVAAPSPGPPPPHPFQSQPNNSRCAICGGKRGDHR